MPDVQTGANPDAVALYDEAGNRVTLVGATGTAAQVPVKFHSTAANTTTVSVPTTAGGINILAASSTRKGATVYNESGGLIYLLCGNGTVSATVYTVQMAVGAYYEVPYGFMDRLAAIAATTTTTIRVTEFT